MPPPKAAETETFSSAANKGEWEHAVQDLSLLRGTHDDGGTKVHFLSRTDYNIYINDYVGKGPDFKLKKTNKPRG